MRHPLIPIFSLNPGTVTNIACKWKRSYAGFKTKEPWYILTNLDDLHGAITAYQKRFSIEQMFKDMKTSGYNLEKTKVNDTRFFCFITLNYDGLYFGNIIWTMDNGYKTGP